MTDRLGPSPQDRYRQDLGAYLAGALEPDERAALEIHLPTCTGCQADLARLAPLPGLLRRLQPADLAVGTGDQPPPSLREGVLSAAAARRRAERRSLRLWRGTALAGLAAAAAVIAVLVMSVGSATAPRVATLKPVALSSARGTADIHARPWGTQIILHLSGLPVGVDCEAWVVTAAGRTPIGSWGPTGTRRADIEVAASVRPRQLALQVTTSTGRALLGYHL